MFKEEIDNTYSSKNDQITLSNMFQPINQNYEENTIILARVQKPQIEVPKRRSNRKMRNVISDDYVVYLQEHDFYMGLEDDPITFVK